MNAEFATAAQQVGSWIGHHGGQLVYGGGKSGLMGLVADAALAAGASVVGVIPQALVDKECAHLACTERADAFLALPGGIGTFEELFEVWTWRQLGYHDKPIGLLNVAGYYDKLLDFLDSATAQDFMGSWQMGLLRSATDAPGLLAELVGAAGMSPPPRLDQI
jgi:uncharacterized protein (TIGR00730 family)